MIIKKLLLDVIDEYFFRAPWAPCFIIFGLTWFELYYLEETSLSEKWFENQVIWELSSNLIDFSLKSLYNQKTLTKQMKNKRFLKTSGKTIENELFWKNFDSDFHDCLKIPKEFSSKS